MRDDYGFESFIPDVPDDKDFDELVEMNTQEEVVFGFAKTWPEVKVGGTIYSQAAAPGCGHCVYLITRINEKGEIYARIIEDTIRELTPEECI